jgi:hypothetical protein
VKIALDEATDEQDELGVEVQLKWGWICYKHKEKHL